MEWEAAREGFADRAQALRNRLGVLSLPALDAGDVVERWEEMGLAARRAVLSTVFERIEVHRATIRGYDPERIKLVWRIPRLGEMPVAPHPLPLERMGTEADAVVVVENPVVVCSARRREPQASGRMLGGHAVRNWAHSGRWSERW